MAQFLAGTAPQHRAGHRHRLLQLLAERLMKTGLPIRYRSPVNWTIGQQKIWWVRVCLGPPRRIQLIQIFLYPWKIKKNLIFHDLHARQIENGSRLYLSLDFRPGRLDSSADMSATESDDLSSISPHIPGHCLLYTSTHIHT